jgi:RNAse (barnase) inhibitor barstar
MATCATFACMKKCIVIEGDNVHDITSFYEEVNRVFMRSERWKIGQSLDAFNDLMYGSFGEIKQDEPIQLTWHNIERSQELLGVAVTRLFYQEKLGNPVFNSKLIQERLSALENGSGPTFFEIVIEIIKEHPNIELIRA